MATADHADFVHLAVRSAYSLLEGAIHLEALAEWARAQGQPAVAVTDTNNLFGALEASETLCAAGVQPITGCTLSLKTPYFKDAPSGKAAPAHPVRLLVRSEQGYRNLCQLVSRAHLETEPAEGPHATLNDLRAASEGLLLLTGGPEGPLGALIAAGRIADAGKLLTEFEAIFPGAVYVELMRHGLAEERATEAGFLDLAYARNLPLLATNDAHFIASDMYEAHDALLCIAEGTYVSEAKRRRLTPEHRLKTAAEMTALFSDLPEAIENTLQVARRCAFAPLERKPILPKFPSLDGLTEEAQLARDAKAGLEGRLATHVFSGSDTHANKDERAKPYRDRLAFELKVITEMGFAGYFLIVADFIRWAKENAVPVGPGRGSGAGSVVAWSLGITELDPLRFGLLFERFLNPERISMPDFDIDFCQEERDRVIRYVQDKYGAKNVAQIITFGTLNARAVMRDVGRVLQQPYPVTDRLCKMIPNNPASPVPLAQAIEDEPRLQYERESDDLTGAVIERALKLEGLYRHASTHAAGVVIGDRPLEELIPLYRDPRSDMPVTGFSMKWVEKAGLVKFDFLGLKTLTVLRKTLDFLKNRGVEMTLEEIPLTDAKTYAMLSAGDTAGVFQLEGSGMRKALHDLKPDKFEDIIALVALYRPGPMDNIPSYINRKHGVEEVEDLHESLRPLLAETYGVIIYQEQVMEIAKILAGYSLGEADILRRAMGKKIQDEMDAQQRRFVEGAEKNGVAAHRAAFIFNLVAKFAGYGFNKSHAAAYALIAYQTAYFKANYPVEFMAATMSLERANTDKLAALVDEVKAMGIPLLPPDVNRSEVDFTVEDLGSGERGIRYALSAIKNVGAKAMEGIVAARTEEGPFKDVFDLMERSDPAHLNKRQFENLIAAGALDALKIKRAVGFEALDSLMRHAQACHAAQANNQESLFGGEGGGRYPRFPLPEVKLWDEATLLKREREALGFYFSTHPLEAYGELLRGKGIVTSSEITAEGRHAGSQVRLAGMVEDLQIRKAAKSGKNFGFLTLSDAGGTFDVLVFSDFLDDARKAHEEGKPVIVQVSVDRGQSDDSPRVIARAIEVFDPEVWAKGAELRLTLTREAGLPALKALLENQPAGEGRVTLVVPDKAEGREVVIQLPARLKVSPALQGAARGCPGVAEAKFVFRRATG
jgi:DNA polymerase III subunit alpha